MRDAAMCWFFRLAGLTVSGGTITEGISERRISEPLSIVQLSLFGSCYRDHLAQAEISIQLLVKLAISESLEKEAYTHMVGTVCNGG